MHRKRVGSIILAFLLILPVSPTSATPLEPLLIIANPTPAPGDSFGTSIASVGGHVLVGAPGVFGGADAGAAYLFHAATGALLRSFQNPAPNPRDYFGYSVAASENHAIIGARGDSTAADGAGAVYVFCIRTGELVRTIFSPTPSPFAAFGWSVAMFDGGLIVGAVGEDFGYSSGAAYIFDGANWQHIATIKNPTPAPGDAFGSSVAGVGTNALVGAPFDDSGGLGEVGVVYLFSGVTGELIQTFHNPTPEEGDDFGISISTAPKTILIGSLGAVYLFGIETGNLTLTFVNPSPDFLDEFGHSVAAAGDSILIGAPGDDTNGFDAGAVYLFDRLTGELIQSFQNPEPATSYVDDFPLGEEFGYSIAAGGDTIIVGTPLDNLVSDRAGGVYLFRKGIRVEIDIRPGSEVNVISLKSRGVIPVAVLGSPSFDARAVDPWTVRFGSTGYEASSRTAPSIEDVDSDVDQDLVLHFGAVDAGIRTGDSRAILKGRTYSGISFMGTDDIIVR